jgi:predicted lipoprotein with Yx(FWY)xxD motif
MYAKKSESISNKYPRKDGQDLADYTGKFLYTWKKELTPTHYNVLQEIKAE